MLKSLSDDVKLRLATRLYGLCGLKERSISEDHEKMLKNMPMYGKTMTTSVEIINDIYSSRTSGKNPKHRLIWKLMYLLDTNICVYLIREKWHYGCY